ncbi:MAG TPA: SpoVR family protein [Bacteroidales bacterium]|nr:SpoVR family protein [Bacteroidales bacterium]HPS15718.1 SpoVR family protein [Bacteroidales bacterium]
MYLIDQHTKKIMEECKERARAAGLSFNDETLEYIVTNRDMIGLSPKNMIPTLYDYWVHDVEVLKEQGKYKLYPHNPYETVINSRPAISFYNDNNPDWLNIMIFYHVLAHIDFFQNNILFEKTWNDDFVGLALSDKRLIESLRSQHGRWVDYVIEFSRGIDNITGYFRELPKYDLPDTMKPSAKFTFYFEVFLQEIVKVPQHAIFKEIDRFNNILQHNPEMAESVFFNEVQIKYPEFQAKFDNNKQAEHESTDVLGYIIKNSPLLKKGKNSWMSSVMSIVRNTSLYFGPQIRSKIMNEGWASYWHDELFRGDERIKGHEVDYARINAGVTSLSRVGLNPYAIGMRLIQHVEDIANKGKISFDFQKIENIEDRENYNKHTNKGKEAIFSLRKNFSDFMLLNTFIDQDFMKEHDLFVVEKRANTERGVYEYFIKSRRAEDYKKMMLDSLYHPPYIKVIPEKTTEENLYLSHSFEAKQLYKPYIPDVLLGIEFLWGGQVQLETTEIVKQETTSNEPEEQKYEYRKVLYTMKDKNISKTNL